MGAIVWDKKLKPWHLEVVSENILFGLGNLLDITAVVDKNSLDKS